MRDYGVADLRLDAQAALGECPLWSAAEHALYWVDIAGRAIHRFDPDSGHDRYRPVHSEPGCLALAGAGVLVVAMRDGFYRFDTANGVLEKIAGVTYDASTTRFNDGRCDRRGRFWAGTMYEPRTDERAAMYCLERGAVRTAWGPAEGLGVKVSNGLAFSPDGCWVYQSDTPNHVIYRFAFDVETGRIGARQPFARVPANRGEPSYGGRPDGAVVDSEGCYWSAQYEGGRVLRFSPTGELVGVLRVPARRPTMVAFGGPALTTLFITSAREGADAAELAATPYAGGIFACELDVPGLPEPHYADAG